MKFLRWILFIPAQSIYVIIVLPLVEKALYKVYDIAFPLENFRDYFGITYLFPLAIFLIVFYFGGLATVVKIAPNSMIGARILLVLTITSIIFFFYIDAANYNGLRIFFNIGTVLILALMSFIEIPYSDGDMEVIEKEENKEEKPKSPKGYEIGSTIEYDFDEDT